MIVSSKNKALQPIKHLTKIEFGSGTASSGTFSSPRGSGTLIFGNPSNAKISSNSIQVNISAGAEPTVAKISSARFPVLSSEWGFPGNSTSDTVLDMLENLQNTTKTNIGIKKYEVNGVLTDIPFVLFKTSDSNLASTAGVHVSTITFNDVVGDPTDREVHIKAYQELQGWDETSYPGGAYAILRVNLNGPNNEWGTTWYYVARWVVSYTNMGYGHHMTRTDKTAIGDKDYQVMFDLSKHKTEPLVFTNNGLINVNIEHEVNG